MNKSDLIVLLIVLVQSRGTFSQYMNERSKDKDIDTDIDGKKKKYKVNTKAKSRSINQDIIKLNKERDSVLKFEKKEEELRKKAICEKEQDQKGVKKLLSAKNQRSNVIHEQSLLVKKLLELLSDKDKKKENEEKASKYALLLMKLALYKTMIGKNLITKKEIVMMTNQGMIAHYLTQCYNKIMVQAREKKLTMKYVKEMDAKVEKLVVKLIHAFNANCKE